jgi:ABC-2 type transport system permease protein
LPESTQPLKLLTAKPACKCKMKKYWFIFEIQLTNSLAYPAELLGRSLVILPFMWIFYQLWRVTFMAAGTDEINGLTLHSTLWYLMLAETIELSRPRLGNTISEAVKDGSIAYILSKPYDFLLYQFSATMGETIFRAGMNALLGGAMVWLLVGAPPDTLGVLVVLPALLGAWTLNFCISALIGLSAFWVEDISAFVWIYQKLAFVLGGLLIPLDFYPGWLQSIARSLPFAAMTYGPARLFVDPVPEMFFSTLLMQVVWITVFAGALAFVYRKSVTALTVNGG